MRMYRDLAHLWPVISPPPDYEQEVATFRTRLARHGVRDGARLLHLGCGGGSIDHILKRHYDVTGVDASEAMLAVAQAQNPDVRYVAGDMRTCRLAEAFDAVLVHDAISHMLTVADLEAVYATAAAHLRPGGVLVALPEEIPERVRSGSGSTTTRSADGIAVTLMERHDDDDPSDTVFETTYIYVIREGDEYTIEADRQTNGVFPLEVFLAAIERAGFRAAAEPWEIDWDPADVPMPLITGIRT